MRSPVSSHLGILAGLVSEVKPFGRDADALPITTALSGARPALAVSGAETLVQAGCTHLLSYGLAGGLRPDLVPGTLLLPDRIIDDEGRAYPVDAAWHARLTRLLAPLAPQTGAMAGSDTALVSVADKQALLRRTGALAVDMESHILARTAAARGLPFLVLRVVADSAAHILPPAAMAGVKPDGRTDVMGVLGSLIRQPGQLPDLIRLGRAANAANRTLLGCAHLCLGCSFGIA